VTGQPELGRYPPSQTVGQAAAPPNATLPMHRHRRDQIGPPGCQLFPVPGDEQPGEAGRQEVARRPLGSEDSLANLPVVARQDDDPVPVATAAAAAAFARGQRAPAGQAAIPILTQATGAVIADHRGLVLLISHVNPTENASRWTKKVEALAHQPASLPPEARDPRHSPLAHSATVARIDAEPVWAVPSAALAAALHLPPTAGSRQAAMLIDRYINRAQLHAFVVVFVSLAGLYFVFDAFTNMEEFITHAAETGSLSRILATYYGCRLIWFFDATSPVITLASGMFALSWLERHNELTALLAAGVSRWRIARPVIMFAAGVSLLAAANRELVLPQIRAAFARNAQDLDGQTLQPFDSRYDHRTDILFRGRGARAAGMQIEAPSLLMPPALGDFGPQITATEATWRPAIGGRPAGYLLSGVREPADIDQLPAMERGGTPVVLTPSSANWLTPGQCFVASDVTFEQMIGSENWSQYSSTLDLVAAMSNPSLGLTADIPLRVHARFTAVALDLALLLLGIPLVLGPTRRGVFAAVGATVGMTVIFFMVVLGSHSLTQQDVLSPSLGAWMPLLVLGPLASWAAEPMWR
jgi:lipopolysaccharide export system permease protein